MKNNFPKIPFLFSIIFFLLFSSVLFFLYKEIHSHSQSANQKADAWQSEATRRDDLSMLTHSIVSITDEKSVLDMHFAESSDVVPFLDTIEKLAPDAGAKEEIDSVDTLPDNTGLVVGLKATGTFESLYKFLTLLENSPYELTFLSMDIHQSDPDNTDKTVKISDWEGDFKIQLLSFTQ